MCVVPCNASYGEVSGGLHDFPIKPVCVALLQLFASAVFTSNYGIPQYFVPIIICQLNTRIISVILVWLF